MDAEFAEKLSVPRRDEPGHFLEGTLERSKRSLTAFRFTMVLFASATCGFAQPTLIPPMRAPGMPPYRLKVTVLPGLSVTPDREEPYIDSHDDANATLCDALNLWVGVSPAVSRASNRNPCGAGPAQQKESVRHIAFDLNQPVASTGKPLGLIRDKNAHLHVFLSHDHERLEIKPIQALQPGEQAQSDRVQFVISVNGVPHVMLVGPWGPGTFNRAQIKPLHGEGSTKATVKRVSETLWEVQSAENSLGRLWNNADRANPVDLGLYRVSFRFRFELLSETAE